MLEKEIDPEDSSGSPSKVASFYKAVRTNTVPIIKKKFDIFREVEPVNESIALKRRENIRHSITVLHQFLTQSGNQYQKAH